MVGNMSVATLIKLQGVAWMKKRLLAVSIMLAVLLLALAGCGGLSGTYESESGAYSIEFKGSSECTWYQDGSFFDGTYEKTDDGYRLEIVGGGLYTNTVFDAVEDQGDLIISGGSVDGERFIKK
jgi:hypothetical protein